MPSGQREQHANAHSHRNVPNPAYDCAGRESRGKALGRCIHHWARLGQGKYSLRLTPTAVYKPSSGKGSEEERRRSLDPGVWAGRQDGAML